MKSYKTLCIILINIFLTMFFTGCVFEDPKYINLRNKPNLYSYSNEVYIKIKNNEEFTIKVFDYNLYKYYDVPTSDNDVILSFFQSLTNDNYKDEIPEDITSPCYKLIIEFNNREKSKYIIDVYNNNFVTLFPWDGNFPKDKITMDDVPKYDNLYDFCIYIINKRD